MIKLDATKILRLADIERVAVERLAEVIERATPKGFSGRLKRSVVVEGLVVGYEEGVETAGNKALDRRSVIRRSNWVPVDELATIFYDAVDSAGPEIMSVIEREVASGLS